MLRLISLLSILAMAAVAADVQVIVPAGGPPPVGPYSPGLLVGDYLYVSGQGAVAPDGHALTTFDQQVRQCLDNVKAIVEAADLTLRHVVYAHLYLPDLANLPTADRAWRDYFPDDPPARAVVGVTGIPGNGPVEITVVAIRNLADKRVIELPDNEGRAVLTRDRLYLAGINGVTNGTPPVDPAEEVRTALDRARRTLEAAGLSLAHMVFINPYLADAMPMNAMNRVYADHFEFGNTPARATLRVAGLSGGARFVLTGVAVRDLAQRRAVRPKNMPPSPTASPCVFAGDTLFCSAKSGFIPGPNSGIYATTVENQVRQTMRNLLDGLEEAGMNFSNVVASNVYIDTLAEFTNMNGVYGSYFEDAPPTRTTLQLLPPTQNRQPNDRGRVPMLEQISMIAVQ